MKAKLILFALFTGLVLAGCGGSSPEPVNADDFLTLADVIGKKGLSQDGPEERVINLKAKAYIKKGNLRGARTKAIDLANRQAVDAMVRELLSGEVYNKKFKEINSYMSKDINGFVIDSQVTGEKKIYLGKFYGIAASVKVNRQKVLVALQKDLKLIDNSSSTLITVITSKKSVDLTKFNISMADVESAMLNQAQTDLNQRGLRAMDHRNAISSLQMDAAKRAKYEKISGSQFAALIAGSKSDLPQQVQAAEDFYTTGLTLLKQLAKVVVEVNIISVSKTNDSMVVNINVTAKNIASSTGGAFANTVIQVARRGGKNSDDSAMVTALIKDAYEEMKKEFIPQVIKEMSTIDVADDKLIAYDLVFTGYTGKEPRKIRKAMKRHESDGFRFLDHDNTLAKASPPINTLFVRYQGKVSDLSDKLVEMLDDIKLSSDEPMVQPGLTELVFKKSPEE